MSRVTFFMKLILVESPTKARTLARFLGKKYRIEATFGHLRDLPKSEMGVDVEHDFSPKYIISRDKLKRVKELKILAEKAETIILATDPDREGEAISWHVKEILSNLGKKKKGNKDKKDIPESKISPPINFQRITFHEITEEAIQEALLHPGEINMPLVDAQQARRILDRLVGYELSPLLWKKLSRRWLSAGRVQSVAVRLIVEREREIDRFVKQEYWVIEGEFESSHPDPPTGGEGSSVSVKKDNDASLDFSGAKSNRNDNYKKAKLVSLDNVKYEVSETLKLFDGSYTFSKTTIVNSQQVDFIIHDFKEPFTVSAVTKKEIKRYPAPPFTTSAMQIDAGRKLGYSTKRIMQLAQRLYEDGLITYHRTDSVNLSAKFLGACKSYIEQEYGKQYSHYRTYTTKSKTAQEAHEAIRPTQISRISLDRGDERERLYSLIWKRAVASQAAEAVFDSTTININSNNGYLFETQGSVIKFDGYLKIVGYDEETILIPDVKVGDILRLDTSLPVQKFTAPPPRYSEAALIKALEEDGIGRPSTYAPTLTTIQERLYVEKETKEDGRKGRNFVPTELGYLVIDFLVRHFPEIVKLPFTAKMEEELDEIAAGKRQWVPLIAEFYTPFAKQLAHVRETVETLEAPVEKTGLTCPECKQGDEIIKQGRFGKFLACSRFPDCKYTKNLIEKIDVKCPECNVGEMVVRKSKRGRVFYGCDRYPECKYASWIKPKVIPKPANPEVSI